MAEIILLSAVAGILGTTIGGAVGLAFKKTKFSRYFMGFSAGFMLSICAFELVLEGVEMSGLYVVALGFAVGMIFVFLISGFVEKNEQSLSKLAKIEGNREKLITGLMILLAISLHNLPEGLAIGGGETVGIGLTVAVLIAVHNIPEGAAMAVSLNEGGMKWGSAILMCALSGVPTVIGAILGKLLAAISVAVTATCLGLAAGAMCQAVFGDIFPKLYKEEKDPSISIMVGFLAAMLFTFLVNV